MKEPSINFESLLEANDRKFKQSLGEIKARRKKLSAIASEGLADWFRKQAAETVEQNFRVSSKLDDNRLREMKKAVDSLADNSQAIIEKHFAKSWSWEDN